MGILIAKFKKEEEEQTLAEFTITIEPCPEGRSYPKVMAGVAYVFHDSNHKYKQNWMIGLDGLLRSTLPADWDAIGDFVEQTLPSNLHINRNDLFRQKSPPESQTIKIRVTNKKRAFLSGAKRTSVDWSGLEW